MSLRPLNNQPPPIPGQRWAADGKNYRRFLGDLQTSHSQAITQLGLATVIANAVYGPTVTPDLSMGGIQRIVVTNNNPFTIAAPINITQLANWELVIVNESGGAMGTVTFASNIHQSGYTNPANTKRTAARFYIDGSDSFQTGQWGPAV